MGPGSTRQAAIVTIGDVCLDDHTVLGQHANGHVDVGQGRYGPAAVADRHTSVEPRPAEQAAQ